MSIVPWRADVDKADLFAIIAIDTGDVPDDRSSAFDALLRVDGCDRRRFFTERPAAKRVYVIYWPGVLEIPWPEGMTAQQVVRTWTTGRFGFDDAYRPSPETEQDIRLALLEGRVRVSERDGEDPFYVCILAPRRPAPRPAPPRPLHPAVGLFRRMPRWARRWTQ